MRTTQITSTSGWKKGITADQASEWLDLFVNPFTHDYRWNDYFQYDGNDNKYKQVHNPTTFDGHVVRFESKGDVNEVKWWKKEREEQMILERKIELEKLENGVLA